MPRQAGSCALPPSNPDDPQPDGAPTKTVTLASGTPSPVCKSNCGKLCTGFYCNPQPTGTPPGFFPVPHPSTTGLPSNPSDPNSPSPPTGYYVQIGLMSPSTSNYAWAVVGGNKDSFDICSPILYKETPHTEYAGLPLDLLGPWKKDSIECVYQPYPDLDGAFGIGILYCGDDGSMGCQGYQGPYKDCSSGGIKAWVECGADIKPRDMTPPKAPENTVPYRVDIVLFTNAKGKSRWTVLANGENKENYVCDAPLYASDTIAGWESYPSSTLGSFKVDGGAGIFTCNYEGADEQMGKMMCTGSRDKQGDGPNEKSCVRDVGGTILCDNAAAQRWMICTWTD